MTYAIQIDLISQFYCLIWDNRLIICLYLYPLLNNIRFRRLEDRNYCVYEHLWLSIYFYVFLYRHWDIIGVRVLINIIAKSYSYVSYSMYNDIIVSIHVDTFITEHYFFIIKVYIIITLYTLFTIVFFSFNINLIYLSSILFLSK